MAGAADRAQYAPPGELGDAGGEPRRPGAWPRGRGMCARALGVALVGALVLWAATGALRQGAARPAQAGTGANASQSLFALDKALLRKGKEAAAGGPGGKFGKPQRNLRRPLLEALAGGGGCPKFENRPRVRREWRQLSEKARERVARALWTMKLNSTEYGRKRYGPHFTNYDELLLLHACSVADPRCDQGHTGPHFMNFHRLLLLKVELSLLQVDPKIEALPYWDMAKDSVEGEYYQDPEKWIFTAKYFGSFFGRGPNYAVNDGLFANWPIAEWTPERFGRLSPMARESRCVRNEWFRGFRATTCMECCNKTNCACGGANSTYRTYLRNHDDCTPLSARQPDDPSGPNQFKLGGTYDMVYRQSDYEQCVKFPDHVRSWMQWHNCQDPGYFFCKVPTARLARNGVFLRTLKDKLLPAVLQLAREKQERLADTASDEDREALRQAAQVAALLSSTLDSLNRNQSADAITSLCGSGETSLMVYGYYNQLGLESRGFPYMMHGMGHFKFGRDFLDVSTSPNDPGAFTGHHSHVDRSNMEFMIHSVQRDSEIEAQWWHYPRTQSDLTGSAGAPPYALGGPFSLANVAVCAPDPENYTFYRAGQSPWLPGTLLDDVVNAGYPFVDLFNSSCDGAGTNLTGGKDCSGRATGGYTNRDVLYFTAPQRTPYTYDTLAHYFKIPHS